MYDVSIIIPVYNDPEGLSDTLDSLTNQEYPADKYEILVVDNDSDDRTPEVARSYAERSPNIIVLTEDEIQSSYAARNKGIEHATGQILAFVDADVKVDQHWLETGVDALNSRNLDYMGCRVDVFIPPGNETFAAKYNQRTDFPVERFIEVDNFAPTCALFVRKGVIEDVGVFDDNLISGGDFEFGNRVHAAGYSLGYESTVIVHHPARTTLKAIFKKSYRVGIGSAQLAHQYPDRFGTLSTVNPIRLASRELRRLFGTGSDEENVSEDEKEEMSKNYREASLFDRLVFLLIGSTSKIIYLIGRLRGVYTFSRATRK